MPPDRLARRPAGVAVRALVWLGPEKAEGALVTLKRRLPQTTFNELVAAAQLPTWLARSVGKAAHGWYLSQPSGRGSTRSLGRSGGPAWSPGAPPRKGCMVGRPIWVVVRSCRRGCWFCYRALPGGRNIPSMRSAPIFGVSRSSHPGGGKWEMPGGLRNVHSH